MPVQADQLVTAPTKPDLRAAARRTVEARVADPEARAEVLAALGLDDEEASA